MNGPEHIISDNSLHRLMQLNMLFGPEEDNQTILSMESKTVFAQDISYLPTLPGEAKLMKNLSSRLGRAMRIKLFCAGLAVSAGLGIYASVSSGPSNTTRPQAQPGMQIIPAVPDEEVPVQEPGIVPSLPNPWSNPLPVSRELVPLPIEEVQTSLPAPVAAIIPEDSTVRKPQESRSSKGKPPVISSGKTYSHVQGGITMDTTFDGITRLEVDGAFCDVVVRSRSDSKAKLRASALAEFKGLIVQRPEYHFTCERIGNTMKVALHSPNRNCSVIVGKVTMEGLMELEVPKGTELVVKNSGGDIDVRNMTTKVFNLHAGYGDIYADDIAAPVVINSSSGDITLKNIEGAVSCRSSYGNQVFYAVKGNITASSSSGDASLYEIRGKLDLNCSSGDISGRNIFDDISVKSASGSVKLQDVYGNSHAVTSHYGDITLQDTEGDLKLRSSSGNVTVIHSIGVVDIAATYGYTLLKDVLGDTKVKSSSGNITVQKLTGDIDFLATYGNVDLDHCTGNMAITVSSGHIYGKNIQLRDKMVVRSTYGNLRMQLLNPMNDLNFDLTTSYGDIKINKDNLNMKGKSGRLSLNKGPILVQAVSSSGNQVFE